MMAVNWVLPWVLGLPKPPYCRVTSSPSRDAPAFSVQLHAGLYTALAAAFKPVVPDLGLVCGFVQQHLGWLLEVPKGRVMVVWGRTRGPFSLDRLAQHRLQNHKVTCFFGKESFLRTGCEPKLENKICQSRGPVFSRPACR